MKTRRHNTAKAAFKAGALLYALLITTLLGLLTFALINLSDFQRMLFDRDGVQIQLHRLGISGINMLLENSSPTQALPLTLTFGPSADDSLSLERSAWGAFDLAIVKAWRHTSLRTEMVRRIGLVGLPPDSIGASALYLQEFAGQLTLAGNSLLRGRVYAPRGGVQAGFVNSTGFNGTKLVQGTLAVSSRTMPAVNTSRLTELRNQIQHFKQQPAPSGALPPITLDAPFDAPEYLFKAHVLSLDKHDLRGKIILAADSLIIVGKHCQLNDVILMAPEIRIAAGFKGRLQAFATRQLSIGHNTELEFPSVAAILKDPAVATPALATIGENCLIHGLVLSWNGNAPGQEPPKLSIGAGSRLSGQVYADGPLELQGKVLGHVTCRQFALQTSASQYTNHLLDVVIDASQRPKDYALSMISGDVNQPARILLWLP